MDKIIIPDKTDISNHSLLLTPSPLTGSKLFMQILKDWHFSLRKYNLRPVVYREISKVLSCKDPRFATVFFCEDCSTVKSVPFTCKSRFCPSCGNLYNKQRACAIGEHLLDVPHRHVIFTIPELLRPYFLHDRTLLNFIFEASSKTYSVVISKKYPDLIPGIASTMHTFSRSSSWNPHVHCLATEGGINKWGSWKHRPYIDYKDLRLTFQDLLLKKLRTRVPNFRKTEFELKEQYKEGFFVYAPPVEDQSKTSLKTTVKYVTRYLGRPCIGTSRIDSYDGHIVTFHYDAHVSEKIGSNIERKSESISAVDFLLRLTDHIQDPNFKMVRYYGIYSSVTQDSQRMEKAFQRNAVDWLYSPDYHKMREYYSHWQGAYKRDFGEDPQCCPNCQKEMTVLYYRIDGKRFWHLPPKGYGAKSRLKDFTWDFD
ncbi:MAG: transposase [Psychrobacillus sp.]|jgi:hypothetical protein